MSATLNTGPLEQNRVHPFQVGEQLPPRDGRSAVQSDSSSAEAAASFTSQLLPQDTSSKLDRARVMGLKPWMLAFQENMPALPVDTFSNAKPEAAVTTHFVWDVKPDFSEKTLRAKVTYTFTNKIEGNAQLVLDAQGLNISSIVVNDKPVKGIEIVSGSKSRPNGLSIPIPPSVGQGTVSIEYTTDPKASGLFWIDAEYTNGKHHPLLYTLFESTEGASAIPGQHSPQVRMTYEVNVHTESEDLIALGSFSNNPKIRNPGGHYEGLRMGRAIPLYLASLQIGALSYHAYDGRCGVYTEESLMPAATEAFKQLPDYIATAENFCGPYNWGRYDVTLLPWAFPYMAMEHPCNSTCGQICLERPGVIPHELSHSWTGNDITNATWTQFFFNEGLTVFLETLISEEIFGENHAFMEFLFLCGEMREAMDEYRGTERSDILRLCQKTDDFEFTRIPYAKGALFFFMLREALGKESFDSFLKDYMKVFYQNSMSDARFLNFLELWLRNEMRIVDFQKFKEKHRIDEWLYEEEIPSNAPVFRSATYDSLLEQKDKIIKGEDINREFLRGLPISSQAVFLSLLGDQITSEQLEKLDAEMGFGKAPEMSIREEWSRLCAKVGYITPATKEAIASYLIERNSQHKANQIAVALSKHEAGRELIQHILTIENGRLFPNTRRTIEEKLVLAAV